MGLATIKGIRIIKITHYECFPQHAEKSISTHEITILFSAQFPLSFAFEIQGLFNDLARL